VTLAVIAFGVLFVTGTILLIGWKIVRWAWR
jgi:hypothetical protein